MISALAIKCSSLAGKEISLNVRLSRLTLKQLPAKRVFKSGAFHHLFYLIGIFHENEHERFAVRVWEKLHVFPSWRSTNLVALDDLV